MTSCALRSVPSPSPLAHQLRSPVLGVTTCSGPTEDHNHPRIVPKVINSAAVIISVIAVAPRFSPDAGTLPPHFRSMTRFAVTVGLCRQSRHEDLTSNAILACSCRSLCVRVRFGVVMFDAAAGRQRLPTPPVSI